MPLMMAKQIEPGSTWLDQRDSDNLFVIGRLKPRRVTERRRSPSWSDHGADGERSSAENAGRGIRLDDAGLVHPRHSQF